MVVKERAGTSVLVAGVLLYICGGRIGTTAATEVEGADGKKGKGEEWKKFARKGFFGGLTHFFFDLRKKVCLDRLADRCIPMLLMISVGNVLISELKHVQ